MKRIFYVLPVIILLTSISFAQDTVRIMTYNILRYPDHSDTRNEHLARAVRTADPDILVCQEMKSQEGVDMFLDAVMTRDYSAGIFKDGNGFDTDNAIFYKHSIIQLIDHVQFYDSPRRISQFRVVHIETLDTLLLYGVHLKASNTSEDAARRNESAVRIRNITDDLEEGSLFILLGDFNIYYSDEPAYQTLLDQQEPGYFRDPINSPGDWHNNYSFRYIHTQSTRTGQLSDGGASGGLDDRFDMILISNSFDTKAGVKIIPNSYTAYGNDGLHFNKSINEQPNDAVSPLIADALYYASDHLPVYADFIFPEVTYVSDDDILVSDFQLSQNFPNPFSTKGGYASGGNPHTTIAYKIPSFKQSEAAQIQSASYPDRIFVSLKVYDILGREVATLVDKTQRAGEHEVKFNAEALPSGVYFYQLRAGEFTDSKKMMLLR